MIITYCDNGEIIKQKVVTEKTHPELVFHCSVNYAGDMENATWYDLGKEVTNV